MYWIVNLEGGPRRVNHASVAVGEFIYSFGGYCTGEDYHSNSAIDVHVLNTHNMRWAPIPAVEDENGVPCKYPEVPFQRYGHTAVAFGRKVYLWGGRNDEIVCDILFCFDTKTRKWTRPSVTGTVPGARDGHSACIYEERMYIFGGFEESIDKFSCDVYYLDLRTMHWTYVNTLGEPPSYRDFHSATVLNHRMYVFGGRSDAVAPYHSQEEIYCPNIKYLDLRADRWYTPKTTGEIPVGRRSHSAFTYNNKIYIFAGYNGNIDKHFNDLYCFDPERNVWRQVTPQGQAPRARRRQSCLVIGKRMYLFGGTCPTNNGDPSSFDYSDTHVLDFEPSLCTLAIIKVLAYRLDVTSLPQDISTRSKEMGRAVKNLEPPRPLKSTLKQSHVHLPVYEVQSIEELITLTENVAASLANGCNNADGVNALLANLRLHGPQLENVSKDTLDRALVIFRNASQDERLNIMTRLNLLQLIELRAKSWQVSDGANTYYKHKATNVEPDILADPNLLGSSPPMGQAVPALAPGELIRTSGKFPKPTKIPGKTYCKDEIVIRNADSGKVATGAKERLVQITGPNEEKINYAKQLIEDTIRRNASPVRLDNSQDGSCSSLASSGSDETVPRKEAGSNANARNALVGAMAEMAANNGTNGMGTFIPNQQSVPASATGALSLNLSGYSQTPPAYTHPKLTRNGSQSNAQRNSTGNGGLLLHSFSTNDASLGEYKYTVNVGQHNLKITGDCLELVKVAKLVLDDYFSSNEFLASVDMCSSFDLPNTLSSPVGTMPGQHSLITGTPFVDSGVGLNNIGATVGGEVGNSIEMDDDVFIVEAGAAGYKPNEVQTSNSSSSSNATISASNNGLSRSRRSHFSRKDSAGDGLKETAAAAVKVDTNAVKRIEYERLIYYSKSPYSWDLPADWKRICETLPYLVKNKDIEDQKNRFNGDQFLEMKKQAAKDGSVQGSNNLPEGGDAGEQPPSNSDAGEAPATGDNGPPPVVSEPQIEQATA
uniref:K Homology domain-containing protein n=1 Tax=Anopheles minimus TaxID=112268 RepID=A0A182VUX6_9DIPT